MNIAIFCVFIASILPILFVAYAKVSGGFRLGKDNSMPRDFLSKLEGRAFLAKCAHDNSWEAFAPFAAAVILALHVGVHQVLVDRLSVTFIIFRIFYGLSYIFNRPTLRSTFFFFGWGTVVYLFFLSWSHTPQAWYQKFF